jgi:hypothetical protein
MMSDSLPSAAGQIRAGSLRAVAMSSAKRHPAPPEVPTFREQGIDLVNTSWFGMSGPAGMSPAMTDRLNREISAVLAKPMAQRRFAKLGGPVSPLSPAAYAEFIAGRWRDGRRWCTPPAPGSSGVEREFCKAPRLDRRRAVGLSLHDSRWGNAGPVPAGWEPGKVAA